MFELDLKQAAPTILSLGCYMYVYHRSTHLLALHRHDNNTLG